MRRWPEGRSRLRRVDLRFLLLFVISVGSRIGAILPARGIILIRRRRFWAVSHFIIGERFGRGGRPVGSEWNWRSGLASRFFRHFYSVFAPLFSILRFEKRESNWQNNASILFERNDRPRFVAWSRARRRKRSCRTWN